MKLNTASGIITVALIMSIGGFILSAAIPLNKFSDTLMSASLFCAATSGIVASVFTKKLVNSKQWNFLVVGALLLLLGFAVKIAGLRFIGEILRVSGGLIAIPALGFYIYLHRADFKNSKWIWFIPFILLGCLFKHMYWPGANMIIFSSLLLIILISVFQLVKPKQNTRIQVFILAWQIAMCVCIAVFYFRYVRFDAFLIGYIFFFFALVDIFLQHEKA